MTNLLKNLIILTAKAIYHTARIILLIIAFVLKMFFGIIAAILIFVAFILAPQFVTAIAGILTAGRVAIHISKNNRK
jgi:hypothetical protein